ncbi:hypothetical protein V8C86DRAFT_2646000 [Haematococcus lacustris]
MGGWVQSQSRTARTLAAHQARGRCLQARGLAVGAVGLQRLPLASTTRRRWSGLMRWRRCTRTCRPTQPRPMQPPWPLRPRRRTWSLTTPWLPSRLPTPWGAAAASPWPKVPTRPRFSLTPLTPPTPPTMLPQAGRAMGPLSPLLLLDPRQGVAGLMVMASASAPTAITLPWVHASQHCTAWLTQWLREEASRKLQRHQAPQLPTRA